MEQPVPTLQEQVEFNDAWNLQCRSGSYEELPAEARAQGSMVIDMLRSLHIDHPVILEVGCGTGWLTEKLAQIGACTGVDLSGEAIDVARRRGFEARLIAGDFLAMDLPRDHFDVCINIGTVTAFADQRALFDAMARLLKPGGYLYIITNNRFVFERRSDVAPPAPGNVRKWIDQAELRGLLRQNFKVTYARTFLPGGDRGILRIVNSFKLNALLRLVLADGTIARLKENMGWGRFHVVLARRRNA